MGCGNLSKSRKGIILPITINRRVSKELLRGETLSTDRDSRRSSRVSSLKLLAIQETTCLKFKIFEDFQDLIPEEADTRTETSDLAHGCRKDIKFIKKHWILFNSALSYFELVTHGSCIDNFCITDGVVILILSNISSGNKLDIEIAVTTEVPYVQILSSHNCHKDTIVLIKAWQNIVSVLNKFTAPKIKSMEEILGRFEKLLHEYEIYEPDQSEVKQIKKSKKNLRKLIECIRSLLKDVKFSHESMKEFVANFKLRREELEKLGALANNQGQFTGEQIVHYILSE